MLVRDAAAAAADVLREPPGDAGAAPGNGAGLSCTPAADLWPLVASRQALWHLSAEMVQPALWLFQLHYIVTEAARTCYTGDLRPPFITVRGDDRGGVVAAMRSSTLRNCFAPPVALESSRSSRRGSYSPSYVASRFLGETLAREGVVASVVFILTWTPTVVFRALYLAVWAPAISYFHIPAWAIIALLTPGATAACVDTRGWKQKWGKGCDTYENDGHCANGAVVEGHAWSVGADFNFPEQHCCACGKKAAHCDDDDDWKNPFGKSCADYSAEHLCSGGGFVAGQEWTGGADFGTRRPTAASAASRPRRRRRRRRGRRLHGNHRPPPPRRRRAADGLRRLPLHRQRRLPGRRRARAGARRTRTGPTALTAARGPSTAGAAAAAEPAAAVAVAAAAAALAACPPRQPAAPVAAAPAAVAVAATRAVAEAAAAPVALPYAVEARSSSASAPIPDWSARATRSAAPAAAAASHARARAPSC